jgi:hypothetical protein
MSFMGPNLVYLPLFIIRIISAQLVLGSSCIPTIFVKQVINGHILINYTKGTIWSLFLGEIP